MDRRRALVQAAYARIADKGFEGLRTRDVAADVGLNVATLHYYFPTKESLIRGVVAYAVGQFGVTVPSHGSAVEQLREHLALIRRLHRDEPRLFAVLSELALRAPRDQEIAAIMRPSDEAWHGMVRRLLERGVAEGGLARDVDPDDAAGLVVAAIKGASMPGPESTRLRHLDQTFRQLERWLGLTKA